MPEQDVSRRAFLGRLGPAALGMLVPAFLRLPKGQPVPTEPAEPTAGELARLRRPGMGTWFEIVVPAGDAEAVAAANHALSLIDGLESQLTIFHPESEVSRLNQLACTQPVAVEAGLFALLESCRAWSARAGGAFDPGTGGLTALWRQAHQRQEPPTAEEVAALVGAGTAQLELEPAGRTVRYAEPRLQLDLGGVGKGYAVDRLVECLRGMGVTSALVHGGHSSIYALGAPPGETGWVVDIDHPWAGQPAMARLRLRDRAMSTSGSSIQYFERGGRRYGHVLDPRTGWPAERCLLATALAAGAAEAEAASTALFVLGSEGGEELPAGWPGLGGLVIEECEGAAVARPVGTIDWEELGGISEGEPA